MQLMNTMTRRLTLVLFACGLAAVPAFPQEGDIVQQERAKREQEMRDQNARGKVPDTAATPTRPALVAEPDKTVKPPAKNKKTRPGRKIPKVNPPA